MLPQTRQSVCFKFSVFPNGRAAAVGIPLSRGLHPHSHTHAHTPIPHRSLAHPSECNAHLMQSPRLHLSTHPLPHYALQMLPRALPSLTNPFPRHRLSQHMSARRSGRCILVHNLASRDCDSCVLQGQESVAVWQQCIQLYQTALAQMPSGTSSFELEFNLGTACMELAGSHCNGAVFACASASDACCRRQVARRAPGWGRRQR